MKLMYQAILKATSTVEGSPSGAQAVNFLLTAGSCWDQAMNFLLFDGLGSNQLGFMLKVNIGTLKEESFLSPKGKFASFDKEISEALGRKRESTDVMERHPFDVEITRVPPGKANCPYHSHSAQWEYFQVISGNGSVRHQDGATAIGPGDAFLFKPGEPHQIINDGTGDLVYLVVADNPIGESCHYPDSNKWVVRSPESRLIRSEPLDYFDGEE